MAGQLYFPELENSAISVEAEIGRIFENHFKHKISAKNLSESDDDRFLAGIKYSTTETLYSAMPFTLAVQKQWFQFLIFLAASLCLVETIVGVLALCKNETEMQAKIIRVSYSGEYSLQNSYMCDSCSVLNGFCKLFSPNYRISRLNLGFEIVFSDLTSWSGLGFPFKNRTSCHIPTSIRVQWSQDNITWTRLHSLPW